MEQPEQLSQTIARIIRETSETGQLTQSEDIWTELVGRELLKSDGAEHTKLESYRFVRNPA